MGDSSPQRCIQTQTPKVPRPLKSILSHQHTGTSYINGVHIHECMAMYSTRVPGQCSSSHPTSYQLVLVPGTQVQQQINTCHVCAHPGTINTNIRWYIHVRT